MSSGGQTSRLVYQDRLIAWNTIRATFASWHDRVIAALLVLTALTLARAWFADRAWTTALWAAIAAGAVIGIEVERLVAKRLSFHAFDGLLAADGLNPRKRRHYIATCHSVGLMLLMMVTLIARPSLLIASVPAYLAGALTAGLTSSVKVPKRLAGTARPSWTARAWLRRPIAGVLAATVLLLSLVPARTVGGDPLIAISGTEAMLLALLLTAVDDAVVRFMAIAGHGSGRTFTHHAKGVATFLAIAVPGCRIMLGPTAAGIVAAIGVATLLLLVLRILVYRLHRKRVADLLVSILAGLLVLVAYAMPVALPLIILASVGQLQRRGRTKTWLLT